MEQKDIIVGPGSHTFTAGIWVCVSKIRFRSHSLGQVIKSMFTKINLFAFCFIVVYWQPINASPLELSIEVVNQKQTLLSTSNIQNSTIKHDAHGKPYVQIILSEQGIDEVSNITKSLQGKTVNIWLGKHPISISTIVHSEINTPTIRVPVDSIEQAKIVLKEIQRSD